MDKNCRENEYKINLGLFLVKVIIELEIAVNILRSRP